MAGELAVAHSVILADAPSLSAGDTAWVLASSALVLLMTPALAFFYGGMVRGKTVLNMLMMNFLSIGIVSVIWVLYGWSVAFGNAADANGSGIIGGFHQAFMHQISRDSAFYPGTGVPVIAVACFQLMFAIITPALISGSLADRTKFTGWCVYVFGWASLCYFPVAHWVFSPNGFINAKLHVMDFAGGTAVHINAGAAGLAACLVIGKRIGWKKDPMRPHNVPFVMLGAGLLWFGWFGFNAGSELLADGRASMVFLNTNTATAAAMLGWLLVERFRDGHFTSVGAASGAVAGLVAITPACASVSPVGAIGIGFLAGAACAWAISMKYRLGFDDALDVVGVHLVGGIVGTVLIGFFATPEMVGSYTNGASAGLFYGGGAVQLGRQAAGAGIVLVYSFVVSGVLSFLIEKTIGFRVSQEAEVTGVDTTEHAETAYDFSGFASSISGSTGSGGGPGPAAGNTGSSNVAEKVDA